MPNSKALTTVFSKLGVNGKRNKLLEDVTRLRVCRRKDTNLQSNIRSRVK